ncbi:MAG: CCA tRNA nucleotidyltransferase [Planctomycetes bacterium]|nr:CCA tRNA nucleotidyltransferase [Planctomycetota bacterium]
MSIHLEIPASIAAELSRLRAAGDRPLLVGGAVRDALLGLSVHDFDVASRLPPAELASLYPRVDPRLGAAQVPQQGLELTVTSMRRDGVYTDQRRPDRVEFVTTPEEDAVRRDFTINALYYDPFGGELVDPCGGHRDLRDRVLRVIGDPERRLHEDPLRMLRAVRFAARYDLTPEPSTAAALRRGADALHTLSAERVLAELTASFTGRGRGRALRLLLEFGLAPAVLPEIVSMPGVEQPAEFHPEGDVFVHVCLVLDHVPEGDPVLSWAAVLHDTGKPATFERAADRIRFSGHDTVSAEIADQVLHRLRAPRELRETVVEVVRDHIRIATLFDMKPARRARWMRSPRFPAHLEFHRADCLGSHGKLDIYQRARGELESLPPEPPPPLCTGRDVLALGVPEGPAVGGLLRRLQAELDAAGVSDRDTALRMLGQVVEESFRGSR